MKATTFSKLWRKHELYGDGRAVWLVVHDPHAGLKHVYTVYRIALTGTKEAQVIGRELPLALARKVVKRSMESIEMQKPRVGLLTDPVITRRVALDLRVPAVLIKKLKLFTVKEDLR